MKNQSCHRKMNAKCGSCGTPMSLEESWAPNDLDKRRYGECPACGWETDDEYDEYHMPEKEVLIAHADGSRYIHGEGYEVGFTFENWYTPIATKYSWEGDVEITIRPILTSPSQSSLGKVKE